MCRLAACSAGSRGGYQLVSTAAASSAAEACPGSSSATGGEPDHWPVVIVGAGPTGLTLSALLSRMGVRSLLLESAAALTQHPQVRFLHSHVIQEVTLGVMLLKAGIVAASLSVGAFARPPGEAQAPRTSCLLSLPEVMRRAVPASDHMQGVFSPAPYLFKGWLGLRRRTSSTTAPWRSSVSCPGMGMPPAARLLAPCREQAMHGQGQGLVQGQGRAAAWRTRWWPPARRWSSGGASSTARVHSGACWARWTTSRCAHGPYAGSDVHQRQK